MRVLLTCERFPPDYAGGGEWYVLETAKELVRRGVEVEVISTGRPACATSNGIKVSRFPIHRYLLPTQAQRIAQMAERADVIQTFNYHACLPSLIAGRCVDKPVICTFLGLLGKVWHELRGSIVGRAWEGWERFLVSRSYARTVFLSEHCRQLGIALGAAAQRTLVCPPGISASEYQPSCRKKRMVLFVGRFDARKGVRYVLDAAAALPDVNFIVCGWGDDFDQFKSMSPANTAVIPFDREQVRQLFADAAIFVLPSKGEGFPKAILEAMASGCAIISTVPLDFRGETLELATLDESLIPAIRRLWHNPDLVAEFGRGNFELAQKYDWSRVGEFFIDTYRRVLVEWRSDRLSGRKAGGETATNRGTQVFQKDEHWCDQRHRQKREKHCHQPM